MLQPILRYLMPLIVLNKKSKISYSIFLVTDLDATRIRSLNVFLSVVKM